MLRMGTEECIDDDAADDLAAARALFVEYEGSRFYMDRNGVRGDYESYGVSPEQERVWLEGLAARYETALGDRGNWRSVHFFWHRAMPQYLRSILDAKPLGVWWECCSYLEMTLKYIDLTCRDHYPPEELAAACSVVGSRTSELAKSRVPRDQRPDRLSNLIAQTEDLKRSFGSA